LFHTQKKSPTNPLQAIDEAALRRFGDAVEARSGAEDGWKMKHPFGFWDFQVLILMRFNIQHHPKNGASRSLFFLDVGNRQKVPVNSREGTGFMLTHNVGMLRKPTNRSG